MRWLKEKSLGTPYSSKVYNNLYEMMVCIDFNLIFVYFCKVNQGKKQVVVNETTNTEFIKMENAKPYEFWWFFFNLFSVF